MNVNIINTLFLWFNAFVLIGFTILLGIGLVSIIYDFFTSFKRR